LGLPPIFLTSLRQSVYQLTINSRAFSYCPPACMPACRSISLSMKDRLEAGVFWICWTGSVVWWCC